MATESVKQAATDTRGEGLDRFNNVMDDGTAEAIFKAMSALSLAIEATTSRSLDRAFVQWPNTGEAVWDILDGILIRAGFSDGKERPWVAADEAETA